MILAAGEALVEIMRPRAGVPLGRPGETFAGPFASGAPAIFASVAARLGAPCALAAVVGDDPFGALIRTRLASDGVDVARVRVDPVRPTGCAFVAYDESGGREFVFHLGAAEGLTDADLPERADWLHVSGSTLALSAGMAAVLGRAAHRIHVAGGRIGLDPNLRAAPPPELREIAARAHVLFPSEAESAGLDAPVVCTTLGARGVRVRAGDREEFVPAPDVIERDPTGAGDHFAAAFTVATVNGAEPVEAARAAVITAAAAVGRLGPAEAPVR